MHKSFDINAFYLCQMIYVDLYITLFSFFNFSQYKKRQGIRQLKVAGKAAEMQLLSKGKHP
ncbi:hypothetical protein ACFOU2_11930 [Bacillus songklensis]|uniref:Uncharacterized protein n=1 Tax=Bacillus songklensis TaxID=1069116 RepID=A0ABV8B1L6_9BACI